MPRKKKQGLKNFNIRNFPEELKNKLKVIAAQKSIKKPKKLYEVAIEAIEQYVRKESK